MLAALGWSSWLAIAALGISLLSVGFTYRADRRAGRTEQREVERDTRTQEEADAARRATFAVTPTGSSTEGDGRRHYQFTVRNVGAAAAHELEAWLENELGERVSGFSRRRSLMHSEVSNPPLIVTTHVPDPSQLVIVLRWTDGAGSHQESSRVRPTL